MTSIVQLNGLKTEQLGTRLSCFGSGYKMAEYFFSFHEEEMDELLAKNITGTAGEA